MAREMILIPKQKYVFLLNKEYSESNMDVQVDGKEQNDLKNTITNKTYTTSNIPVQVENRPIPDPYLLKNPARADTSEGNEDRHYENMTGGNANFIQRKVSRGPPGFMKTKRRWLKY